MRENLDIWPALFYGQESFYTLNFVTVVLKLLSKVFSNTFYVWIYLKCACHNKFIYMCLLDNLADIADCGGLAEITRNPAGSVFSKTSIMQNNDHSYNTMVLQSFYLLLHYQNIATFCMSWHLLTKEGAVEKRKMTKMIPPHISNFESLVSSQPKLIFLGQKFSRDQQIFIRIYFKSLCMIPYSTDCYFFELYD